MIQYSRLRYYGECSRCISTSNLSCEAGHSAPTVHTHTRARAHTHKSLLAGPARLFLFCQISHEKNRARPRARTHACAARKDELLSRLRVKHARSPLPSLCSFTASSCCCCRTTPRFFSPSSSPPLKPRTCVRLVLNVFTARHRCFSARLVPPLPLY